MVIGVFTNINAPAIDFYRTVGCFAYMQHTFKWLQMDTCKWWDIIDCDIIVMKSPNGLAHIEMLKECKNMGKKIILDYDDNIHRVERDNPSYVAFNTDVIKQTSNQAFELGDYFVYSTQSLQDFYTPFHEGKPSMVINNGWNPMIQPFMPIPDDDKVTRYVWRGTAHHLNDLATVSKELNEIASSEDSELTMLGMQDFLFAHLFPNAKTVEWTSSLFEYFKKLNSIQPHYGICPLLINEFNLAKSNIFAIEMICAGTVTIASQGLPEFTIPGIINYDKLSDTLEAVKRGEIDRKKVVTEGRIYLNDVLRVDKLNKKREEIINFLK